MKSKWIYIIVLISLTMLCGLSANAVNWPLRISSNENYLEDQDGVPFLVIADTAWSLAGELSETEVSTYLDDRQSKGYTAILVSAIEHTFSSNPPYNYNNEHPFTNGSSDWSIRNEAYWTHVDYILNQAKNRGILVFLLPAYLGYQCGSQGWCVEMRAQTNATMTNYGAWLGNRYSGQGNIIWVHGGDADADQYSNAYDRVAAIANGIKAATNNYLHTAHSGPEKSAMDDYNAIIDLNTAYSYGAPDSEIRTEYQRTGAKPLMFIEGYYENEHSSTIGTWQSQAMTAYLGGALVGQFFGNCPIWHFGSDSSWCGSTNWEGNLDSSGSNSIGYIGKLMLSRKWYDLEPDYTNSVVTSSKGTGLSYHATARTADGETVMVWCPNTNQVTVDMSKISDAESLAKAWWYDPDDNSATVIGTYENNGTRTFTPPSSRVVLVIDSNKAALPAPGSTGVVVPPDKPPIVSAIMLPLLLAP